MLFPPAIPAELATAYASAHRRIVDTVLEARRELDWSGLAESDRREAELGSDALVEMLEDHQRSIERAMSAFRGGSSAALRIQARRDLGLSKGMDQHSTNWAGPSYRAAIDAAVEDTLRYAAEIYRLS